MDTNVTRCALASGIDISRVITGLWQVADMEREGEALDVDQAARAMDPYVEAGFTTFDMADHYGSAEEIAGSFVRARGPRAAQLLTKWVPPPGPVSRGDVRAAVERALARMNRERLELLQFHTWSYADPHWLDCLFYLQELKREGLIAHLGLTNVDTAHLHVALASGIEIVSNQVSCSLLDRRAQAAMSELCAAYRVKLLAYGTVAGGFLSDRWLGQLDPGQAGLDTWSQMKYYRFIQSAGGWEVFQTLLEAAKRVADKHGVPLANVASRYVLEQPAVGAVIIGARLGQSEHIADTQKLFSFSLDAADQLELEQGLANLQPIPGDCGDEYRKPPFLTASGDLSHHLESFPPPYPVTDKPGGRRVALSGTPWESLAGYGRAIRVGERISVSGTTATHGEHLIGGGDAAAQTHFVIDKIEGALQALGGRLEDVVRTRIFVNRIDDWEVVARAHGARFKEIQPANTLVQAPLVGDGYLVEIEAEAIVSASP